MSESDTSASIDREVDCTVLQGRVCALEVALAAEKRKSAGMTDEVARLRGVVAQLVRSTSSYVRAATTTEYRLVHAWGQYCLLPDSLMYVIVGIDALFASPVPDRRLVRKRKRSL